MAFNSRTMPFRVLDCALSSSLADALSSALAAVFWLTFSISATALATCSMPRDCSSLPNLTSSTRSFTLSALAVMDLTATATRSSLLLPSFDFAIDSSIRPAVSLAACAQRCARLRTSSATTANPMPASPARAASTAALSARMLVWKAISSMTLMIFEILSLDALISFIDKTIWSRLWLASDTRWAASDMLSDATREFSVFFCAIEWISSLEAEVSSMDAACSDEPCARDWLDDATWAAAAANWSEPSFNSAEIWRRLRFRLRTTKYRMTEPAPSDTIRMLQHKVVTRLSVALASSAYRTPSRRLNSVSARMASRSALNRPTF